VQLINVLRQHCGNNLQLQKFTQPTVHPEQLQQQASILRTVSYNRTTLAYSDRMIQIQCRVPAETKAKHFLTFGLNPVRLSCLAFSSPCRLCFSLTSFFNDVPCNLLVPNHLWEIKVRRKMTPQSSTTYLRTVSEAFAYSTRILSLFLLHLQVRYIRFNLLRDYTLCFIPKAHIRQQSRYHE